MTSRLVKAVRKAFRIKPRPYRTTRDCVRQGHVYQYTHATYGPIKVLTEDQAISWNVLDGHSVWEPNLVETFQREVQAGRDVLDVGANLGLHTIILSQHLARLGRGGTVFAFEPHPEIFPLTAYNCAGRANIKCINKAASDGTSSCFMPSILAETNAGGAGVVTQRQDGMYAVESITIDSLQLENIGFMKVDVEGHEMSCLEGARETIRRCRPTMVVEIMGGSDVRTAPPPIAAEIRRRVEFVCGLGYSSEQISEHDYLFRPL